jgi:hypothetical protein
MIKFRAWDTRVGRWYGSVNAPFEWEQQGPIVEKGTPDFITRMTSPQGVVLQQFTGFHDKNGKEICEGDIVQYPDFPVDGFDDVSKREVVERAKYFIDFGDDVRRELEIIGQHLRKPRTSERNRE